MCRKVPSEERILNQINDLKKEMKKKGIRRISFMNTGIGEAYEANKEMYRLETALKLVRDGVKCAISYYETEREFMDAHPWMWLEFDGSV